MPLERVLGTFTAGGPAPVGTQSGSRCATIRAVKQYVVNALNDCPTRAASEVWPPRPRLAGPRDPRST
jgi:hypothetical protein